MPMIIYIDINHNVQDSKFTEFEIKLKQMGLQA